MSAPDPRPEFLCRLDEVEARLARLSGASPPPGLTAPDPPSGERWDWPRVWGHLAEFVGYWMGEVRTVAGTPGPGPVPFGRVKSDADRVAAVEAGGSKAAAAHWLVVGRNIGRLRRLLASLGEADWRRRGVHSTLGEMDMAAIVEEFLVGHLEEHADQLDGLLAT